MIEINLLPSEGKKRKSSKFEPGAMFTGAADQVKDKYLLSAIGVGGLSLALLALLFVTQTSRANALDERNLKAVKDSSQFSSVLAAKNKAEATRDSLYQQVAIIRSIDDTRFMWSHLMYEISTALPAYTWLTEITQTTPPRSAAASDTSKRAKSADTTVKESREAKAAARKARSDSLLMAAKDLKFRLVGHTVDIQALTRFMKALEASPFIQNVQLTRSDVIATDGREVTEFSLEAETQPPAPFAIKTVPLLAAAGEGN